MHYRSHHLLWLPPLILHSQTHSK